MTDLATPAQVANPLLMLLDLAHRARDASGPDELAFMLVNDSRLLAPYRQAGLWFEATGIQALSGVMQPEANAPYALWLEQVCQALSRTPGSASPRRLTAGDLPAGLAAEWQAWLPAEALWVPFAASPAHPGSSAGGLLLAGEAPFSDDALALFAEWGQIWRHAWLACFRPSLWSPGHWRHTLKSWREKNARLPWWKRRTNQLALVLAVLLLVPVRLTVLAQGELVPARPAVIRAPLDGVIGQFQVRPNELVKAGQVLFTFDDGPISSRLEVARQALATAEVEYRQFAQMALSDARSKGQLAVLLGKIGEKRAEAEFLASQFERSRVVAPRDGVVLFDDPSEWIGRPVQTGERVMRVADPQDVEIEAWIPIGDAIPLAEGAAVSLYLAADPFSAVPGTLRYLNHDATLRPDGSYAYRARAALQAPAGQRVGLKGTAKLHGDWVPLGYWILRRPLASIRQYLAI